MKVHLIKNPKLVTVYEPITGRYFKCTHNKLIRHLHLFNFRREMLIRNNIRLNTWLKQIGLSGIEIGDLLSWPSWKEVGYIDIRCEIRLGNDGIPVYVLVYEMPPMWKNDQ